MKKILYLLLLLMPSLLMAQSKSAERLKLPTTPRRYYTQKNYQRLLTLDRDMARKQAFIELSIRDLAFNGLPNDVNIPVVVHILYKSGSDTRTLPTLSDVKKQLDITSKDFRQTVKIEKHEADKKEKFSDHNALDTKISFCLATKDPSGRATSGVLTVPTSVTTWLADDKMKSATTGGSSTWDTEKYLNIWVVNFPDSISGYAQMPAGPVGTDGIVIDARYFGKKGTTDKTFPYTEGKTLTHLIGNFLNVYDLWNETVQCGDDGVDDTPIQNAPTLGNVDYRHVSTCADNPVVMTMNFMDNTNDEMQYMFTNGQKKRMHASLVEKGIRYSLVKSGDVQCGNPNLQALQERSADPIVPFLPTKFSYRIYPNPAQESVNFEIATEQSGDAEFTVFNAQGAIQTQRKYSINEGNQQFTMNCSQWNAGLYFVRLKINETVVTERVVINR